MKALTTFSLLLLIFFTSCNDPNAAADTDDAAAAAAATAAITAAEAAMVEASSSYLNAWDQNDQELMKSLIADNMVRVANGKTMSSSAEEIAGSMDYWHTAMPDFDIATEDIIVLGNKTYTSWKSSGTNTGPLGDAPPTGAKSETSGFTVIEFNDDGKIANETAYFDLLGVMTGFGYTLTHPGE